MPLCGFHTITIWQMTARYSGENLLQSKFPHLKLLVIYRNLLTCRCTTHTVCQITKVSHFVSSLPDRVSLDQRSLWSIFNSRLELDSAGCAFLRSTWHLLTFLSVSQPCAGAVILSNTRTSGWRINARISYSESMNYHCRWFSFSSAVVSNVFHVSVPPGLFETMADCCTSAVCGVSPQKESLKLENESPILKINGYNEGFKK